MWKFAFRPLVVALKNLLFLGKMNDPQWTAVSCKEVWQNRSRNTDAHVTRSSCPYFWQETATAEFPRSETCSRRPEQWNTAESIEPPSNIRGPQEIKILHIRGQN